MSRRRISVRLEEDRHARLAAVAALMGASINEVVACMVDEWADRHLDEARERLGRDID